MKIIKEKLIFSKYQKIKKRANNLSFRTQMNKMHELKNFTLSYKNQYLSKLIQEVENTFV